MRLYISTLTKRFVQSAAYTAPIESFSFKRRDIEPIELHFLNEDGVVEIPAKFLGKVLLVSGADGEFNGKYIRTGEIENGKPVWAKGAHKIKRVPASTIYLNSVLVSGTADPQLFGTYDFEGFLNGKSRYKHTQNQNRFEWKPALNELGSGVEIVGESSFAGIYQLDSGVAPDGKHQFTRPGVAQISWKRNWADVDPNKLEILGMSDSFDGTYTRAPSPYNGKPRWYRPATGNQIAASIQFESAYTENTNDVLGSADNIQFITGTGAHFALNLGGRFVKSSGNNVPNIGPSVDKWTLGNNDAYIVSRAAGTYTNPYRLNLPNNVGYTTSGSSIGGNNWYLDDTLHNNQPQWNFGTSSNPICFLRYDDPANRKWRIIQSVSGTNTSIAELTVNENDLTPLGKGTESVVVAGAGTPSVNGTYVRDGDKNGKPKYSHNNGSGAHLAWHTATQNGVTSAFWYFSTAPTYDGTGMHSNDSQLRYLSSSNVATPDLAANWQTAGTPATSAPPPQSLVRRPGWVKLNNSSFDADVLNAAGGLKNDTWIISEEHWLLATQKTQSQGLAIDSSGHNPLAYTLKSPNPTAYPANATGWLSGWRSYVDGSYGWDTSRATTQIPDRWVARNGQNGTQAQDGLIGWGGSVEFYSESTTPNLENAENWKRSNGEPIAPYIMLVAITYPGRWRLHQIGNPNAVYYEAITSSFFPYGPNTQGDSYDGLWRAVAEPGAPELSSYQQATNRPARWSLANDTFWSETNSAAPWSALNWKSSSGAPASFSPSQKSYVNPEHWGLMNSDNEEQYAAAGENPYGATWQLGLEPVDATNPPDTVTEVESYAPLDGKLAIKKKLLFDGEILAESSAWVENTDKKTYSFTLNLNTAGIDSEFEQEQESFEAMIELTWASGGAVTSSFTLPATIYNDVIRGHEGPPTPPRSSVLAEMTGIAIVFGN